MSFLHYIIPASKKNFQTDLPVYELQNRLNWFIATNARGGPLNGVFLKGAWNGNSFYFETTEKGPGKKAYQYALVFNGPQMVFHSRWKKGYRNAWLILAGCAFIGFTIEMFEKPLERADNLQGLIGFPLIYIILLAVTKAQTNSVAVYLKNMLNARDN